MTDFAGKNKSSDFGFLQRQLASYERTLSFLKEQQRLYVWPGEVPTQLQMEIEVFTSRVEDLINKLSTLKS